MNDALFVVYGGVCLLFVAFKSIRDGLKTIQQKVLFLYAPIAIGVTSLVIALWS